MKICVQFVLSALTKALVSQRVIVHSISPKTRRSQVHHLNVRTAQGFRGDPFLFSQLFSSCWVVGDGGIVDLFVKSVSLVRYMYSVIR